MGFACLLSYKASTPQHVLYRLILSHMLYTCQAGAHVCLFVDERYSKLHVDLSIQLYCTCYKLTCICTCTCISVLMSLLAL